MFLDDSPTPAPSSFTPASVAVRTRIRWENFLLLFVVLAFGAVGVVAVVAGGSKPAAKPQVAAPNDPATTTDAPVDPSTAASTTLTLDDAIGLVDEARQLMGEARWEEAADRLASVPTELRTDSGADTLQVELEQSKARHDQLRAQLDAAVEARQWKDADRLLEQLAAIAPLDDELLQVRATVDSALAPHAPSQTTTDASKGDTTASTGSGSTSGGGAARPQSSSHGSSGHATAGGGGSHATGSSTTKPAAGSKPTTGTSNAGSTNPSIDTGDLGSLQLTDEQQQALNQALGSLDELQ